MQNSLSPLKVIEPKLYHEITQGEEKCEKPGDFKKGEALEEDKLMIPNQSHKEKVGLIYKKVEWDTHTRNIKNHLASEKKNCNL
jgi:hypothetical protein